MTKMLRSAVVLFILLSLITGVIYPLAVAGIGKILFPRQINGSLIKKNQQIIGSSLIGQNFKSPGYFWPRPSATTDYPYNALASGGSNLGPLNPQLTQNTASRIASLRQLTTSNLQLPVPVDLVTASASGLDPEISVAAALYQLDRIAATRQITVEKLRQLIDAHTQSRYIGLLGEPRVNVLKINLALDELSGQPVKTP